MNIDALKLLLLKMTAKHNDVLSDIEMEEFGLYDAAEKYLGDLLVISKEPNKNFVRLSLKRNTDG